MNDPGTILRIAARGDGVTADGRHVAGAVPGDILRADGSLAHGPQHVTPPCRHFALREGAGCGGCQLQHAGEEALRRFVTERVVNAAEGQKLAVDELLPTHLSPPRSRRRATLHFQRDRGGAALGFRAAGSHRIIDLGECHVLDLALTRSLTPLRRFLVAHGGKGTVDVELTLCDQGVDCGLRNLALDGLAATEAALDLAREAGFARLSLDQGYGPETLWEPVPVTVTLGGVPVALPVGAFLQATADAETAMVDDARRWLAGASTVADLFAGLGTFALAIAGPTRVLAVEAARDAHLACRAAAGLAGRPVHVLHRDLFRNPLQPQEIGRFDAVLLDPPRAGARDQIACIADSPVARVVYVSCNPASWARDAARLIEGGFRLEQLRPVGQFRWSTHVELTSYFVR